MTLENVMRRPLVAGNWKMNLNLAAARALIAGIRDGLAARGPAFRVEIVLCPAFVQLFPAAKALDGSGISLGAQNLHFEREGAYTGEVSASMLTDTGAKFVIIGHSERRHTLGREDDFTIHRKVAAAAAAGLTPILCLGETLAQRDAGETLHVLSFQLRAALIGLRLKQPSELVLAYEPVWAIGTGRTATPQQAQEAHAHLRGVLRELVGALADDVRILYGGSVSAANASELFSQPDVDGGLIGGASLKADSFLSIVQAAGAQKSE